jgi:hypothetical protein
MGFTCTEADARALAAKHIRWKVEIGQSASEIHSSHSGRSSLVEVAHVGGVRCAFHDKAHTGPIVHVTRVHGIECCYVFKINELMREILAPTPDVRQLALFG